MEIDDQLIGIEAVAQDSIVDVPGEKHGGEPGAFVGLGKVISGRVMINYQHL